MNSQFKKGILELCVLSLIKQRDFYGYELVVCLSKRIKVSEGTIYPILRRLTKEGFFETYLRESQEGPSRKYYKLTPVGLDQFENLFIEWKDFLIQIDQVLSSSVEAINPKPKTEKEICHVNIHQHAATVL